MYIHLVLLDNLAPADLGWTISSSISEKLGDLSSRLSRYKLEIVGCNHGRRNLPIQLADMAINYDL